MTVELHLGDCLEVMRSMPDKSVDTCITDPPYELGFMGKKWDSSGIAFQPETWQAVFRVLKPGALLLAFGGTRTYHRMVCAIEDAGFEIRDTIAWVYGSGFPKSYDISKGIDKVNGETGRQLKFTRWFRSTGITRTEATKLMIDAGHITDNGTMAGHYFANSEAGQPAIPTRAIWTTLRPHCGNIPKWVDELVERVEAEREVVGSKSTNKTVYQRIGDNNISGDIDITAPSTPEAQLWDGWGTALKPAHEPIVVAMKPIDGSFVNNALTWGVAGLWIDGGRVGTDEVADEAGSRNPHGPSYGNKYGEFKGGCRRTKGNGANSPQGRFPANFIHDGSDEVVGLFPVTHPAGNKEPSPADKGMFGVGRMAFRDTYGDDGRSAARFFYCAKASRSERNAGLEGMEAKNLAGHNKWTDVDYRKGNGEVTAIPQQNHHPTIKPIELMRYLVRLTKTPTGGVVLDPFAGSGTTGIACVLEGRGFIGIEREAEYVEIAEKRIAHYRLSILDDKWIPEVQE